MCVSRIGAKHAAMGMVFFVLLGSTGCKKRVPNSADSGDDEAVVSVQAQHPTLGPLFGESAADAILAPSSEAALAARINAPIAAEYVQRGAHVHKGQLLLTLENRDLRGSALESQGSYTQAQAAFVAATQATIPEELKRAQLDVAQARANLDVANRTAEERKRLLREGAISGRDTDSAIAAAVQAQAAYDTALQHLAGVQKTTQKTSTESAAGQVTSARGRLLSAEAQVGYASLRSPIDGVVTERPFFPGESPAQGTALITVMDTSSLLAKLHLAQATAQKLRLGGAAALTVPGFDEPQAATVSFISPALDPGSTTVEVWLRLPNAGGVYKVGTPVHAVLRGYTVPNALQVPPAAILPSDDGSTNVLVVSSDSTAHRRPVKVGLRTAKSVQILEGLSVTDTVVTEGGYGLDDGAKVKLGDDDTEGTDGAGASSNVTRSPLKSAPDKSASGKIGESGAKE